MEQGLVHEDELGPDASIDQRHGFGEPILDLTPSQPVARFGDDPIREHNVITTPSQVTPDSIGV